MVYCVLLCIVYKLEVSVHTNNMCRVSESPLLFNCCDYFEYDFVLIV